MRFFRILITSLCLISISDMPAFCVPAYPKLVKFTQPDGTTVAYHIRGDEYSHWLESADGYVLKK